MHDGHKFNASMNADYSIQRVEQCATRRRDAWQYHSINHHIDRKDEARHGKKNGMQKLTLKVGLQLI